jgi:NhaP-type Na+/H+ or K+/H+ antiporter
VTTAQILIGFGLIILLASRLGIPALIVLLPGGFTAGALTGDVNPQHLLGASFQPLVSLSVAVILYDAGLGLGLRKLKGHTRKVVIRLIVLGVLITWVLAAAVAAPLLGMSHGAAVMLGIILVVSGPTVVGPLLGFVRPAERLQKLIIGVLFISISATVTPQSIRHLIVPALVLVAALVIVARPVAAFAATLKTDLPKGERAFIGWMAPRGIVAAATASTFGAGLAAKGIGGAAKILPTTFLVIVATVTLYGLTAAPVVPVPAVQATS